jgi:hypothetical protein
MAVIFWTPRRRKNGLIGLAATLMILILIAISINSILAPIIGRKIRNAIVKSSDSLYQVSFSKIDINIFTGEAKLDNIQLVADSGRANNARQISSGSAAQLIITGARPLAYLFRRQLNIKTISIVEPKLFYTQLKTPKPPSKKNQTLYQKISKNLKMIRVEKILLEHAQLHFSDQRAVLSSAYQLKELSLEATNLLIDSSTQKDTARTLFCRDITVAIDQFTGFTGEGLYQYALTAAHYSTRSERLTVRGISVRPLPAAAFFAKSKADRFSLDLDSLVLDRFDYGTFFSAHLLKVKKISAYRGGMSVFSNPNRKLKKTDRIVTFPHYIIRKVKPRFSIDTLDISEFAVTYHERSKTSGKTGTLVFKDTRARFLHISNDTAQLKDHPVCAAQLTSLFMGKGKFDLRIIFNLVDKAYSYHYQGSLAAMQLDAVNPMMMPLAMAKIKTGQLRSLNFKISGDQKKSSGTLHLLYNQLAVDILKPDYSPKVIKTFLAKTLVIKANNPDKGSASPRFAKIIFLRPKNYPFFKTLWTTLLSGLKPCAGVGYAVKPDPAVPVSKQEQKAKQKALKAAVKAKKKADKAYRKKLKSRKNT